MTYFLLIISFFASLVLTFFLRRIGEKYRFYDAALKDPLKIHKKSIPYLGGLGIFLVFLVLFLLSSYFKGFLSWQIGTIISAGFLLLLPGFWDDFKWKRVGVTTSRKLLFLILFSLLATIVLVIGGIKIQFFPIFWFSLFLTFFYIFGLTNAVNFEDGIDGLAGGLVAISLIGFIILSIILGNDFALAFSLIILGAILGFLFFNFPPAKIFMGDSGAYFLGFVLFVLAATFSRPLNIFSILGPIFIIGFPIFDTGIAITRRIYQKKSPFVGDRKHFYDRILQKGFSVKKTLLISYFLQIISVLLGLLIYH